MNTKSSNPRPLGGRVRHAAFAAAAISLATAGYACSDDSSVLPEGSESTANSGGNTNTVGIGGFQGTGGTTGQGGSCADENLEPTFEQQPADIIFIIDNSGSMSDEIDEIQANINNSFAAIIASSSIDYRVIMLTAHGGSHYINQPAATVCITQPLSSLTTTDNNSDGVPDACDGAPGDVPGQFYHFDVNLGGSGSTGVQSTDGLCILLETLYGSDGGGFADEWGLHPEGWIKFLREDAVKVFVMVTDDRTQCTPKLPQFPNAPELRDHGNTATMVADGKTMATRFDAMLTSMAPNQFGTPEDRKYLWYSIVGMEPKLVPGEGYQPSEPIQVNNGNCAGADGAMNSAYSPNTGNQWLSVGTKGLRFPVCATGEYDTVFNSIAEGVIKRTAIPCEFDLPTPSNGQDPDLNTLNVVYTPGETPGPEDEFTRVQNVEACGVLNNAFWVDEDVIPNRIHLCPYACGRIEDDTLAEIGVRFQCGGID